MFKYTQKCVLEWHANWLAHMDHCLYVLASWHVPVPVSRPGMHA